MTTASSVLMSVLFGRPNAPKPPSGSTDRTAVIEWFRLIVKRALNLGFSRSHVLWRCRDYLKKLYYDLAQFQISVKNASDFYYWKSVGFRIPIDRA